MYQILVFTRIAHGTSAKLIPHDDPTDVFFSNEFKSREKTKKEQTSKNKTNTKRENINDGLRRDAKRQKTEDYFTNTSPSINNYLSSHGLKMEYCLPDGNCFFNALEILTGVANQDLRKAIVTRMKIQKNIYKELFTEELRMKYFVNDDNLEARCSQMLKDKTWAGFPERISASHFIGKNIFELYQQNDTFHWNVFFGSTDSRILEQNSLDNVFMHYDSAKKHFSPLTRLSNFEGKLNLTNIYCLLTEGLEGNAAFIHLNPSQLSPNNTMFQNAQQTTRTDQPKGLMNLGLTCYFSALIQSISALPMYVNALEIDRMHVEDEDSFTSDLCILLNALKQRDSQQMLKQMTEDVLAKVRNRFEGEFLPNRQADPQELLIHMQMMINEEQRNPNEITTYKEFPDIEQTMRCFEHCNRGSTTKFTTIYTKIVRTMHKSCKTESFEALPFLVLQFDEIFESSTTIQALLDRYVQKKEIKVIRCPRCNLPNPHTTQEVSIAHLPEILILTVER